jgi:hypothetical protein
MLVSVEFQDSPDLRKTTEVRELQDCCSTFLFPYSVPFPPATSLAFSGLRPRSAADKPAASIKSWIAGYASDLSVDHVIKMRALQSRFAAAYSPENIWLFASIPSTMPTETSNLD